MGDFNIYLPKYDTNADCTAFLDSQIYITIPTRVSTHSKTLIDNTFLKKIKDGLISGNIISTIEDHFAQFLLQKDIKIGKSKPNLFRHNFKNLNQALFDFGLRQADWNTILEIDKKEIDMSFNNFLLNSNNLLQLHLLKNSQIKKLKH